MNSTPAFSSDVLIAASDSDLVAKRPVSALVTSHPKIKAPAEADASHDPAPAELSRLVVGEPPERERGSLTASLQRADRLCPK